MTVNDVNDNKNSNNNNNNNNNFSIIIIIFIIIIFIIIIIIVIITNKAGLFEANFFWGINLKSLYPLFLNTVLEKPQGKGGGWGVKLTAPKPF